MLDRTLKQLSKQKMTRKQFLVTVLLAMGALFGITALLRQFQLLAGTPTTADIEPESRALSNGAKIVTDATASGQAAVSFEPVGLPTTGDLYKRCAFGVATGSTAAHEALEAKLGAKFKNYVKYYDMGHNGIGNWPSVDAAWCKTTGHTLHLGWDMGGTTMTFAQVIAGQNNASLDAFFQSCKAHGDTIILRMWWEMNDPNGPTKVGSSNSLVTSTQEWVTAWKFVYNRCKVTNGCTNVKFFWCANGSDTGAYKMEEFYPGDAYVDIVGFDTYNKPIWAAGAWHTFEQQYDGPYNRVAAITADKTIPIMVGETGSDDGPINGHTKDEWLRQMFTSQKYPRLRQIDWFNYYEYKIDATQAAVDVCRQYLPIAVQGSQL